MGKCMHATTTTTSTATRSICLSLSLGKTEAFNPQGSTKFERVPLKDVWQEASKGNKWTLYFTELADEDPVRIGIGLSRVAETLQAAANRFLHDQNLRKILKDDYVAKIDAAIKQLEKPLAVLNGGKTGKVCLA